MSFERTGYDGSAPWDFTTRGKSRSRSQFDNDQYYRILIYKIPEQRIKSSPLAQRGGHQPKDLRSSLTRARDAMQDRFKPSHLQTPAVAVQNAPTLYDISKIMNDIGDFIFLKAELAIRIMKSNPSRFLYAGGLVTGGLGLFFSVDEALKNPTWINITKAIIGGGVVVISVLLAVGGILTAPIWGTIATAGAIVLFTWQVGEWLCIAIQKSK